MPPVLDIPGVIIRADITRQIIDRTVCRLSMENGVALRRIVGVIERCIFLNDAASVGIVRRALVELMRLQIEPTSKLMRSPRLGDVVSDVSSQCGLLRWIH